MSQRKARGRRVATVAVVGTALVGMTAAPAIAGTFRSVTGPSTAVPPYVVPANNAVSITSFLTSGERSFNGYQFVGVPDALSVMPMGSSNHITLLVNHELGADKGTVRAHGQKGSFVSQWVVRRDGAIIKGEDLIKSVKYWNGSSWANAPVGTDSAAFSRFCSGSVALSGVLFDNVSRKGTTAPIYFANEEVGNESRVFGVDTRTGVATELPALGRASWETTVVAAGTGVKTVAIGNEDGSDDQSQVWVYQGTKTAVGDVIARSGLVGGTQSVIRVVDGQGNYLATDTAFRAAIAKGTPANFTLESINTNQSGAAMNAEALTKGTSLSRVEDGMFDPNHPNDYYFATTSGGAANLASLKSGGIWKLSFTDVRNPSLGGTLTLLLDSTSIPKYKGADTTAMNMPDNLVVDSHGNILIQEDPGNNAVVARIFAYRISDGAFAEVARFDANRFSTGAPQFLTQDEESSGIVEAPSMFGANTYLFDAQVHTTTELDAGTGPNTVEEIVEGGQLLKMTVSNWTTVYGS